jgi:DNA polymerase-3 subunit delta'
LEWLAAEGVEQPEIALAQAGFAPLTAVERSRNNFTSRRRAFSELLVSGDADPAKLADAVDSGELPLVCQVLQRWCYDLLSLRLAAGVRYNPDYAEKLRQLADNADVPQLLSLIRELTVAARALEHPLNPRLVVENLAIRYTRMISRQQA